jgi:hypothetical protein
MARAPHSAPSDADALLGGLLGGALTHMLLWHAGFALAQLERRRRGEGSPPGPDVARMLQQGARGLHAAGAYSSRATSLLRVHPGFLWWAGGALVFFVAILASAMVESTLLQSAIRISYQLRASLGIEWANGPTPTLAHLWLTNGVVWSAIVGAGVWGLAASFRCFDAGRLAPLRLAAILLATVMLVWLAQETSAMREVVAGEMRTLGR